MSNTTVCTPEKLLEGFAKLSPEDQGRVRAALGTAAAPDPAESCCDPAAMMEHMMGRMKAKGADPMALCKKMMEKRKGECC